MTLPPSPQPDAGAANDAFGLPELEACLALVPHAMLVFDEAGTVRAANAALNTLCGTALREMQAMPPVLQGLLGWPGELPTAARARQREGWVDGADGRRHRLAVEVRSLATPASERRWVGQFIDCSVEDERDLARIEIAALTGDAEISVATWDAAQGWVAPQPPPRRERSRSVLAPRPQRGQESAALRSVTKELVEAESLPEYERLQRALRLRERVEVRYAVRHPDIGLRWLMSRVEPAELAPGRPAFSVMTLDVSQEENARRRNEQLLRELGTILDVSPAGIAYFRPSGGTVDGAPSVAQLARCNERFESLLGLPVGSGRGATFDVLLRQAGVSDRLIREATDGLERSQRCEIEFELHVADADAPRWLTLALRRNGSAQSPSGDTVAVLTDVSDMRSQQSELAELARERELMFSLADVGIVYQRDGRIERANPAMQTLTGFDPASLTGLPLSELFSDEPEYLAHSATERRELASQGRSSGERRLRRADGDPIWVLASQRLVDVQDPRAGSICSFVSVDERRRARELMVLQADHTRAILDSVLVGIVSVGEQGIEWMNRSARRMFGGELADFVHHSIDEVAADGAEHPLRRTDWLTRLEEGQAETFECQLKARDGREFWVVGNVVVTGREVADRQLTFALLDIDARRRAQADIAQARASLQRIIETAPLAIALLDARDQRVIQCNQMMSRFAGRTIEQIEGLPPMRWLARSEADLIEDDLARAAHTHEPVMRELSREGEGGLAPSAWDMRIVSLRASAGAPEQLLLVASDVTEQRAADQARLNAAIAQREMLVKEVHHRIKNNLQGVAGLLQQNAKRHPEASAAIAEAVGHVHAIAQVHGLQVGMTGPLRARGVVEAICGSVQRMFGRTIEVVVTGEGAHRFALTEADSIPIALTVNELLTNAIKHGPQGPIACRVAFGLDSVTVQVVNQAQLAPGFSLANVPSGISGLGLVRALLPRKGATIDLQQLGPQVVATLRLMPPAVTVLAPL